MATAYEARTHGELEQSRRAISRPQRGARPPRVAPPARRASCSRCSARREREGPHPRAPARHAASRTFGNIDLDLRAGDARGRRDHDRTRSAPSAHVDVYVPEGVEVDLRGLALFGHARARGRRSARRVPARRWCACSPCRSGPGSTSGASRARGRERTLARGDQGHRGEGEHKELGRLTPGSLRLGHGRRRLRLSVRRRSRGSPARPARVRRAAGRVGAGGAARAVRDADAEHRGRPHVRRAEAHGGRRAGRTNRRSLSATRCASSSPRRSRS